MVLINIYAILIMNFFPLKIIKKIYVYIYIYVYITVQLMQYFMLK